MTRRAVLLSLALFCAFFTANCEVDDVKLGSFEGTYTSKHGFGLFICEDGSSIQGAYDEMGIFSGDLSEDKKHATGEFFEAGFGPCSKGTFEITVTPEGFEGNITCTSFKNHTTHRWAATKTSLFRPSDDHCALRYTRNDLTVEGRWQDSSNLNMDVCFIDTDDDDDENVLISLRRAAPDGTVLDWYVIGHWTDNGKLVQATWYQNFTAGGLLLYVRQNGELEYTWWTGLLYTGGTTYIDSNQFYDNTRHNVNHYHGPRQSILGSDCVRNEWLKPFVKKNLPLDDDDYYYFIQTKYLDSEKFMYHKEYELVAGANHVYISLFVATACLVLLL